MTTSKKRFATAEEYIKTFPEDVQRILEKVRLTIRNAVPNAEEAISYQIPAFRLNGKYFIYFAAWRNHVSVYPVPSGTVAFTKKLSKYVASKGTVKFLLKEPIPYALIKEIVMFRLRDRHFKQN